MKVSLTATLSDNIQIDVLRVMLSTTTVQRTSHNLIDMGDGRSWHSRVRGGCRDNEAPVNGERDGIEPQHLLLTARGGVQH